MLTDGAVGVSVQTLVLGLGNPLLGDDGIGWKVVEAMRQRLDLTDSLTAIEVDCHSGGGLSLMERLVGYEQVVLVDALCTPTYAAGTVVSLSLADLPSQHTVSAHDVNLLTALQLAKTLGLPIPRQVAIIAIAAENVLDFTEACSTAVLAAVPRAVEVVGAQLRHWAGQPLKEIP